MLILLTTPLGVYGFDTENARLERLALGQPEYSGLTWDHENIYLSHSNLENTSLETEKEFRNNDIGVVKSYGRDGVKTVATGISQPHQILMDSSGRLLIANTGLNRIDIPDLVHGKSRSVYLNDITCDMTGSEKTGNHFNGFYEHDNSLFVISHNNGRHSKVWELDKLSFEVVKIHDTKAYWAHNCWVCEHGTVICDSKNGALYDVITSETIWKADQNMITRGLAANDDFIFVGHSEFGNRKTRKHSMGGVWVIDRKSLETVDKFFFTGTGCIIEVRIFDEYDDCHKVPPMPKENLDYIRVIPLTKLLISGYRSFLYRISGG